MSLKFRDIVNQKIIDDISLIKGKFRLNRPFKHVVIDNFLKENMAKELLNEIKREKFIEKESDLFSFKQTDDLYYSRNRRVKEFHSAMCSSEFFSFISFISGFKFKGVFDMAGTLYESGDYLLCHDDELEVRKIAYVLYFSENFNEEDGGNFTLFDSKNGKPFRAFKKYVPLFNRLLIFEVSKRSFHEVEENLSDKKRYAIGGWLH